LYTGYRFNESSVREIFGDTHYTAFERFLLSQMKTANFPRREAATGVLGQTLFSVASEAAFKEVVFSGDRRIQATALTSLAALGNTGAWDLLALVLMSRTVDDLTAGETVKVLSSSDIHRLSECAVRILAANEGPFVATALLPALKLHKEFPDIMAVLFRNDRVRIPDTEELTFEQRGWLCLEMELLFEIEAKPPHGGRCEGVSGSAIAEDSAPAADPFFRFRCMAARAGRAPESLARNGRWHFSLWDAVERQRFYDTMMRSWDTKQRIYAVLAGLPSFSPHSPDAVPFGVEKLEEMHRRGIGGRHPEIGRCNMIYRKEKHHAYRSDNPSSKRSTRS
jgi:hypothetical protein